MLLSRPMFDVSSHHLVSADHDDSFKARQLHAEVVVVGHGLELIEHAPPQNNIMLVGEMRGWMHVATCRTNTCHAEFMINHKWKNKWDKLKKDFKVWNKLMLKQTGCCLDSSKGTIFVDDEWWKKTRQEIPGCGKFRKLGLQNIDELQQCFADIFQRNFSVAKKDGKYTIKEVTVQVLACGAGYESNEY
ncbi:hypothetical protein EJB05_12763, partial [Eragrostis curvula]